MGKIAVSTNLLIVDAEWLEDSGIKVRELPLKDGYYTFVTPLKARKNTQETLGALILDTEIFYLCCCYCAV